MPPHPATAAELLTALTALNQDAIKACEATAAAVKAGGDAVSVTVAVDGLRELAIALHTAKLIPAQVAALLAEGAQQERERAKAEAESERPALRLLSAG